MAKIAVVGSRSLKDMPLARTSAQDIMYDCIKLYNITHYISGGAVGPDQWGEEVAEYFQLENTIYRPDWNKYGKSAGFRRNEYIIDDADHVIIFWDGVSKGTKHDLDLVHRKNKSYELFIWENAKKWSLSESNITIIHK